MEHFQRVLKLHQAYIDNFDTGSVADRDDYMKGDHEVFSDVWQAQVVQGYQDWGVPRSEAKSTSGLAGATLGGTIDGDRGLIGLDRH